jgi:hypothetical protein
MTPAAVDLMTFTDKMNETVHHQRPRDGARFNRTSRAIIVESQ